MPAKSRIPKYRLHKTWGLAVVRLNGRDIYLGKHGSPESEAEYRRVIAEWLASATPGEPATPLAEPAAASCIIAELLLAYLAFAKGYYVKNGKPTGELANLKDAIKPLAALYSNTLASDFGPKALKTVRQAMVDAGLSRGVVNARVNRLRRVFKWGVENQLVSPTLLQGLQTVPGLKRGRCEVREAEPVKPVADAVVETTQRSMPAMLAAMVDLQQLAGMRPGEVVVMRTRDLDTSAPVWSYRPSTHKTEHHGRERVIAIGPLAQAVLRPYLKNDLEAFIFCPQDVMRERRAAWRADRVTPITPSERNRRRKEHPNRCAGLRYTTMSYARAIAYACDAAFPHPTLSTCDPATLTPGQQTELAKWRTDHRWSPNQIRHTRATELRKRFGIEAARVVLGHSSAEVTEIYAEQDLSMAAEIMGKVG